MSDELGGGPSGRSAGGSILLVRPDVGGVGDVSGGVVRALRTDGDDVLEVVLDEGAAGGRRAIGRAWRMRREISSAPVVHVEFGRTTAAPFWFGVVAVLLRRDVSLVIHDLPIVVKHPGAQLVRVGSRWRDRFAYRLLAPAVDGPARRLLLRRAGAVGVFGPAARGDALGLGVRNVTSLDLGADPPLAGPAPSEGRTVVFAGFLAPDKGLDELITAWAQVGRDTDLTLVIAGACGRDHDGWARDLRRRSEELPNPPVWRSDVDDEGFQRLLADAAVVVLPYRTSNPASGVAVRAVIQGRPIVGTRVPALLATVQDGETGLLGDPGDAVALAAHLRLLLADGALRDLLGNQAGRRAAERHSWRRHVEGLRSLYASSGSST